MRGAVLGGGTAGFIAAPHLTYAPPEAELWHMFDPRLSTVGVGEIQLHDFPDIMRKSRDLDFVT
jgi:hypothetical protein